MILKKQINNLCHDLTTIKKLISKTRDQTLNLWMIFANGPKSACLCQANLCPICFFEIPQRTDTGSQNALSNNSAYALNSLII